MVPQESEPNHIEPHSVPRRTRRARATAAEFSRCWPPLSNERKRAADALKEMASCNHTAAVLAGTMNVRCTKAKDPEKPSPSAEDEADGPHADPEEGPGKSDDPNRMGRSSRPSSEE